MDAGRQQTSYAEVVRRGVLATVKITLLLLVGVVGFSVVDALTADREYLRAPSADAPVLEVYETGETISFSRGGRCDEAAVVVATPAGDGRYTSCSDNVPAVGETVDVRYVVTDGRVQVQAPHERMSVATLWTITWVAGVMVLVLLVPLMLAEEWRFRRRAGRSADGSA